MTRIKTRVKTTNNKKTKCKYKNDTKYENITV